MNKLQAKLRRGAFQKKEKLNTAEISSRPRRQFIWIPADHRERLSLSLAISLSLFRRSISYNAEKLYSSLKRTLLLCNAHLIMYCYAKPTADGCLHLL